MTQAIFLSYASQDADAAKRICDALRAAGLEVWFDQSELRGGDAWDQAIRKQIKDCTLFVPLVSEATNARSEGYFRLEWKLAVDRSHLMADDQMFFVPAILGDMPEATARVPDAFRARQWSRLDDGQSISAFAVQIAKLVDPRASSSINASNTAPMVGLHNKPHILPKPVASPRLSPHMQIALACVVVALVGVGIYVATQSKTTPPPATIVATDASKSTAINPLSVMVMPFANQTGDKEKAYIADALTSSITSDLARIRDAFIVPAATAYSLKDKNLNIPQLGTQAAVRFVLGGSVTGSGDKLRIVATLSDTQAGMQLWTENFDGSLSDLFALQERVTARIGSSIAPQMVIVAARESEKRANTPQVADLLLRALALELSSQPSLQKLQAMEALYRQALALEPGNLRAKTGLASIIALQAGNFADALNLDTQGRIAMAKRAADMAEEVRRMDPNEPHVYPAIIIHAQLSGDLLASVQAARRRVELQPKSESALGYLGFSLLKVGDVTGAKSAFERALQFASSVRPRPETYVSLSRVAFVEGNADQAITWGQKAVDQGPSLPSCYQVLALAYGLKGDAVMARKAAAEAVRLNPRLRLNLVDDIPWPGKEAAYSKYIETRYRPAWRLAGLPE